MVTSYHGTETTATSDSDKAEALSKFFSSVYKIEPDGTLPIIEEKECCTKLRTISITETSVKKHLIKFIMSKSHELDAIHSRVLKELAHVRAAPLTSNFRSSLAQGKLPSLWKEPNVTAVFKKGHRKL